MDGREIPGFYFDSQKGKYFKIVPGARATPSTKNIQERLKNEKKKDEAKQREARRLEQRRKQTVVATYADDLLSKAYLQREIGYKSSSYYIRNVWPGACVSGFEAQELITPERHVRYFDTDPATDRIYYVTGETVIQRSYLQHKGIRSGPLPAQGNTFPKAGETLMHTTSPISSLNYMPVSGALVVTTYGSDRHPAVYLSDPERDGPYIGEHFSPRDCSTIWTSAPKPTFSVSDSNSVPAVNTECVAVGASHSLKLFSRGPAGTWDYTSALQCESDVRALAWLSVTTLALGQRDGRILLYDTRSKGSTHILSHPAPINHIRLTDDFTRIVVSGICNTLTLYDMRHAPTPPPLVRREGRGRPHKRQKTTGAFTELAPKFPFRGSKYLIRFSYKNEDVQDLGMDVHTRLGLLAAADEDDKVNIFNLYTGEHLKVFDKLENSDEPAAKRQSSISKTKDRDRIRCLRFADGEDGGVSLQASIDGGVTRYG